ncbi:hypothetical protein B0H34DRAFT_682528 [Crassisporium funariophilum]|nr:hypothetical protein B0H34DRAFT_682528 [Crassisporium funariophilum]
MSEKTARTHSQLSNRSRPRDNKEKKVVFKGVLDNPFRVQWPSIPINLQNAVLAHILQMLEGASELHHKRCAESRKRNRATQSLQSASGKIKRQKIQDQDRNTSHDDAMEVSESAPVLASTDEIPPEIVEDPLQHRNTSAERLTVETPLILRHVICGINEVTKRLETQAHNSRRPTTVVLPEQLEITELPQPLKYVFICRADVDPAALIEHLPHLVASCNSGHTKDYIKLVALPKGSELVLAQALGIRRVAVLGIDVDYPDPSLELLLEPVPILAASWLSVPSLTRSLVPTHIKHLRTTAPKDMKATKEIRMQEKAAAKKRQHRKS